MTVPPPPGNMNNQSGQFIGSLDEIGKAFCVYMLSKLDDDKVIYIGTCQLVKLMQFPDARTNTEFRKINVHDKLVIRAIISGTEVECVNYRYKLILQYRPHCNVNGHNVQGASIPVECIETGERWNTSQACALAHGLSLSALSNHLNGKPSFKSVKGRTYRKVIA